MNKQAMIFFKWTVLVWLNAIVSFFIAMGQFKQWLDIFGIVSAVFTFVAFYSFLDNWLLTKNAVLLRKALLISVLVKALMQFYPVVELMIGILSINFVESIALDNIPFLSAYLITLVDGLLLSMLVGLLMLIGKLGKFLYARLRQHQAD